MFRTAQQYGFRKDHLLGAGVQRQMLKILDFARGDMRQSRGRFSALNWDRVYLSWDLPVGTKKKKETRTCP